jgi:cell wall-associated NlpC family hydrolase
MRLLLLMLALVLAPLCYSQDQTNEATPAAHVLISHDDMVVVALSLIGSPYKYGGSNPDVGFDCSGLVKYILGLSSPIVLPRSAAEMYHGGHLVELSELKAGDLLFFRIGRSKRINHVAVYIGEKRFVHAPSTGNLVRVDKLNENYWMRYFVGARRVLPENDLVSTNIGADTGTDASDGAGSAGKK